MARRVNFIGPRPIHGSVGYFLAVIMKLSSLIMEHGYSTEIGIVNTFLLSTILRKSHCAFSGKIP